MPTQKTIAKDVKTLNRGLLEIFNDLRMGTVKEKVAKEAINAAGKYIKGIAIQLDYKKMTGGKDPIEGL